MPERYAASGLPPIALSLLPYFVYFLRKNAKATISKYINYSYRDTALSLLAQEMSNWPVIVCGLPPPIISPIPRKT